MEEGDLELQEVDKVETITRAPIVSTAVERSRYKLIAENIVASYNGIAAVKDVTMKFREKAVTALIGPSGCGKTTFLRCLNRMHELSKGGQVTGKVLLDGQDLYSTG